MELAALYLELWRSSSKLAWIVPSTALGMHLVNLELLSSQNTRFLNNVFKIFHCMIYFPISIYILYLAIFCDVRTPAGYLGCDKSA